VCSQGGALKIIKMSVLPNFETYANPYKILSELFLQLDNFHCDTHTQKEPEKNLDSIVY
jgi:hypothetical protein